MTAQEFSSEFDLLYNNVASIQAPGLTEYEKSVFLTKAQDEIIKNYFTNARGGNKYQQGIEDSNKRYSDFSCLITIANLNAEDDSTTIKFDSRGKIFKLSSSPKPLMITISETFITGKTADNTTLYQVVPLAFEDYMSLMSKPSIDPLRKQVWKLMGNSSTGNGTIEIVPHWKDRNNSYNVLSIKYVRHPYPIILEDLTSQGLTIGGMSKPYSGTHYYRVIRIAGAIPEDPVNYALLDESRQMMLSSVYDTYEEAVAAKEALISSSSISECCELSEEIQTEILQRAVELAKTFYQGNVQDMTTIGQRSE